MLQSTLSGLISLGSVRHQTRAGGDGPFLELNPIYRYEEVDGGVTRLGSAASETRADSDGTHLEMIPVALWTPSGGR